MEGVADRVSLSEIIVNAIEALLPEMPGLFGVQWPGVEYKVASTLQRAVSQLEISRRYQGQEWRVEEVELLYSLFDLFSLAPRASDRLAEVLRSFWGPIGHSNSIRQPGEGSGPRRIIVRLQAGATPHL